LKRNDRLIAIVIALQQRPETAQALADKLEVSKRTILRDMEALSEIGIPLYAVSGPAGGFRLMDGFKLPPLQFDSQEALAILFSLNAMTKMADTPFNQARWTAIDKLKATMPENVLQQVEPLLSRFEMEIPSRSYSTPWLEKLLIWAGSSVWIRAYYRSERQERWLELLPQRIYSAHGFWYCEAYSAFHREQRTFRIDRFVEVQPIEPPIAGQAPIDRSREQDEAKAGSIHIRVELSYRGALLAEQDPHIGGLVRQLDQSQWELAFDCPPSEWEWALDFFTRLGTDANVLEPPALRAEIYERACRLAERYKPE
jgi:predicted DNA-binding transcriptional regulator YafY